MVAWSYVNLNKMRSAVDLVPHAIIVCVRACVRARARVRECVRACVLVTRVHVHACVHACACACERVHAQATLAVSCCLKSEAFLRFLQ